MSREETTRHHEQRVITLQTAYDELPATSTEHDRILEDREDAHRDLARHTGNTIESVTADLEHRYMLNISH